MRRYLSVALALLVLGAPIPVCANPGPESGPPVEFAQRRPMTIAQAVADVPLVEFDPSRSEDDARRAGPLKLQWRRSIESDEQGRPALLVTLHRGNSPGPDFRSADLLRIYAVDGERLLPRRQLRTSRHIEPLQLFREGRHEFLLVTARSPMGSAGPAYAYHVLWLNGSRVEGVPLEDPSERFGKLVSKGEGPAYLGWNLNVEKTPLALGCSVWTSDDSAARPTGGKIIGTLKLVEDTQGRPSQFVIDRLERIPGRRPAKPPSTEPESERAAEDKTGLKMDRRILEALDDQGKGATLAPAQVVALLESEYYAKRERREWQMLGAVGYRSWTGTARRVAEKFPEAVRRAAAEQTECGNKLLLILGDLGGKENIAFLTKLCKEEPCRHTVLALTRTGSRDAWPALRSVMTRRLITRYDLRLAGLASEALARAGDRQIVGTLNRWVTSGTPDKQRMAMHTAALLGAAELIPALVSADPHIVGEDRELLYRALISCGDKRYLDEVHRLALDETEYLRQAQRESPDPAIAVPIRNDTQNQALDTIAKLGSPQSLAVLDQLATGASDRRIRKRAAEIAKRIRTTVPPIEQPREISINIDRDGNYFLGGKQMNLAEIEDRLKAAKTDNPGQSVIIRSDKRCEWDYVVRVINVCNKKDIGVDCRLTTAGEGD